MLVLYAVVLTGCDEEGDGAGEGDDPHIVIP
jgi:hypothetical protein